MRRGLKPVNTPSPRSDESDGHIPEIRRAIMGVEELARQGGESHPPFFSQICGTLQQGCPAQW